MRKLMLTLVLGLTFCVAVPAQSGSQVVNEFTAEQAIAGPVEQRLQVLKALRSNDGASLIEAVGGEAALRDFLSEGANETEASLAAKLAERADSPSERDFVGLWTTLAGPDGVNKASASWYPRWQAQIPQALAGAQMGLMAMSTSAAQSASMSPLERAQLNELQWALGGWLSRTDFADRKIFNQVLDLARQWILASAKSHPSHLVLIKPEKRLFLLDQAIASGKQALSLYGLDINAALASVQIEQLELKDERARIRTSFKLLSVPMVFEEELRWFDGKWRDVEEVDMLIGMSSQAASEEMIEEAEFPAAPLDVDPVFTAPPEPKGFGKPGCHAPD